MFSDSRNDAEFEAAEALSVIFHIKADSIRKIKALPRFRVLALNLLTPLCLKPLKREAVPLSYTRIQRPRIRFP